jgi:hypothetical protein
MKLQINFTNLPKPEFFARKAQKNALLKNRIVSSPVSRTGLGSTEGKIHREQRVEKIAKRRAQTFSRYLTTQRFM